MDAIVPLVKPQVVQRNEILMEKGKNKNKKTPTPVRPQRLKVQKNGVGDLAELLRGNQVWTN